MNGETVVGINATYLRADQGVATPLDTAAIQALGAPGGGEGSPWRASIPEWVVPLCVWIAIALLVGWFVLGPVIHRALRACKGESVLRQLARIGASIVLCTVVLRIMVPETPEWFGVLGDYFNPPLSLITLALLAAALGIQRSDLEHTRENLLLAHADIRDANRARRLADMAVVLLREVYPKQDGPPGAQLECGGAGPALNVHVRFYSVPDTFAIAERDPTGLPSDSCLIYSGDVAVLFQQEPRAITLDGPSVGQLKDPVNVGRLVVHVRWENVHGTIFCYAADLLPDGHGNWRLSGRLNMAQPCYIGDAPAIGE